MNDGDFRYREPWEAMDEEPRHHFAWFVTYLNLGPRRNFDSAWQAWNSTLPEGEKKPGYSTFCWAANKWDWRTRADAWDRFKHRDLELKCLAAISEAEGFIVSQYAHMVLLYMKNVIHELEKGKVNNAINTAVREMASRIGHIRPQRVELMIPDTGSGSEKKKFLDEEEQKKIAALLKNIGAYDEIEPDPETE